jgi:hypothetical protein
MTLPRVTGMASISLLCAAAFSAAHADVPAIEITPAPAPAADAPLVPPAPDPPLVAIQAVVPAPPSPGDTNGALEFGIEINPAPTFTVAVNGRTYEDVYRSVPFNYTEYLANPGYRHDATMEILFGELRPTTIVRQYEPQAIVNQFPSPYQPYRFSHSERWQYRAPDFRLLNPGCCW